MAQRKQQPNFERNCALGSELIATRTDGRTTVGGLITISCALLTVKQSY